MLGDILISRLDEIKKSEDSPRGTNAFCEVIKRIAVDEINALYPEKVDSDVIVEVYYEILLKNIDKIPPTMTSLAPSDKQYRFRISVRNVFTSNAFHSNGLANHPRLKAIKVVNDERKGRRYTYQGVQ